MGLGISFSLNRKLIVLVMMVSVVVLLVIAYLSFSYADEILRERAANQLISESEVRGNGVLFLIGTRIKETQVISADPEIRAIIREINGAAPAEREELAGQKRGDFLARIQAFEELVGSSIEFEDVRIAGADGRILFSLGRIQDADLSADPLFRRAMANEAFVDFVPAAGTRKMLVVLPIYAPEDRHGKEPAGAAIARMRTSAIDEILLNRGGLGRTGEVYLVDENRMMLSESRFVENAVFRQTVDTLPVARCLEENEELVGFYADYRGVPIYGSSFCARDLGFVLLAEIDEAETVEPIKTLEGRILWTGIATTLGMAVVAFVLARTISLPLIRLRNAANDIAHGNYDVRTGISSRDEIGELSSAFDQMAGRLGESLREIREKEDVIKQQEDILLRFSDHSQEYCVCMIDIVNSTKITAGLSEQQTSEFYRIFLNSMAAIVRRFGGISVKNIGDALLFSFPNLHPDTDDVFGNAIECCLVMCEAGGELRAALEAQDLPPVDYRISATYGPVRIAKLSTSSVNDIFGPTVNRCAKLNRSAPANGLVVGEQLYRGAKRLKKYRFERIGGGPDDGHGFGGYVASRNMESGRSG